LLHFLHTGLEIATGLFTDTATEAERTDTGQSICSFSADKQQVKKPRPCQQSVGHNIGGAESKRDTELPKYFHGLRGSARPGKRPPSRTEGWSRASLVRWMTKVGTTTIRIMSQMSCPTSLGQDTPNITIQCNTNDFYGKSLQYSAGNSLCQFVVQSAVFIEVNNKHSCCCDSRSYCVQRMV